MAYFEKDGVKLYYDVKGDENSDETVVFMNGLMQSAEHWMFQTPVFEKAGYKIIVHDFRGQLKSDISEDDFSFDTHCDDLKALLDHLGIKKVHLVATSYGGVVSMFFSLKYPEIIKSMALIDTAALSSEAMKIKMLQWKDFINKKMYENYYWTMVSHVYSESFIEQNIETLKQRAAIMSSVPENYYNGIIKLLDNVLNHSGNNVVPEISDAQKEKIAKIKTLVIVGENDEFCDRKHSEYIAKLYPNSEFAVIPYAGHVVIFEKPGILNSLILGFVHKNI